MKIIYEKGDKVRVKETGEVKVVSEALTDRGLIRCNVGFSDDGRMDPFTYRIDDVTPVIVDHSAKAGELAKLAELHGLEGYEFDEEIEKSLAEKVDAEARALKNRGMAAQIEFLLGSLGTHPERQKNALELAENIVKDNATKGMVSCQACKGRSFKELCEPFLDGWRCAECKATDRRPKEK